MGMKMMLEQFPEHRRQDPKRGAEARVFDALQNLDLDGHGLYEYRYRREGKQVDYPLWVHALARLAVQVKGGQYEMDNTGKWFLRKPDGKLDRVQSPLEETADGCMEMRDGILEVTGYKNFVAGVLIFPDMERNEEMEHMARERYHVYIIWGLGDLKQDLECIAAMVKFRRPPKSRISESEWRGCTSCSAGERPACGTVNGRNRTWQQHGRPNASSSWAPPPSTSNTWRS